MICKSCGAELSDDAKFCKMCGSPQDELKAQTETKTENTSSEKACPSCGTVNKIDAHFCKKCGYSLDKKQPLPPTYVPVNAEILAQSKAESKAEKYAKADKVFKILSIVFAACLAFFSLTFFLSAGFDNEAGHFNSIFVVLVNCIDGVRDGAAGMGEAVNPAWQDIYANDIFNNLLMTFVIIAALAAMVVLLVLAIVKFANINKHPEKGVGTLPVFMYLVLAGTMYLLQTIAGNSYGTLRLFADSSTMNVSFATSLGISFCNFFLVLYVACRIYLKHGEYKIGGVTSGKRIAGVICTTIGLFIGTSLLGLFGGPIYDIVASSSTGTNSTYIETGFYGVFNILRQNDIMQYASPVYMSTYVGWNIAGSILSVVMIGLTIMTVGSIFGMLDEGKGLMRTLVLAIITAVIALVYMLILHLATDSLIAALVLLFTTKTANIGVSVFVNAVLMLVMVAVEFVLSVTEEKELKA